MDPKRIQDALERDPPFRRPRSQARMKRRVPLPVKDGEREKRRKQPLRLSVLDQSIAVVDRPQGSRSATRLRSPACEALGYERFWVSEHHGNPTIVGTAPEILIAAIATVTSRIRIGSAGIMLPHYRPSRSPSSSAYSTPSRPAASIWALVGRRAPTAAPPSR